MEFKRIILNYKFICIMAGLLFFAVYHYYDTLCTDRVFQSYHEIVKQVAEVLEKGQTAEGFLEEKYNEVQELYNTDPETADAMDTALKDATGYWDYLQHYYEDNEAVVKRAWHLMERCESSGERVKLEKTARDFTAFVSVQVAFGNDAAITKVMDYDILDYTLILVAVIVTFNFFDERKRGMWSFVHTTVRGRLGLAVRRCAIAATVMTAVSVLSYIAIFAVTWQFTGTPDMQRSVQSVERLGEFAFTITVGEFIAVYVAIKVIGILFGMFAVYLLMSIFNSRNMGLLVFAVLFGVEAILYHIIEYNSNLVMLKTYNLYGFMCGNEWITTYDNVALFGRVAVPLSGLLTVLLLVANVLLVAAIIVVNSRKMPSKSVNIVSMFMETNTVGRLMERLPSWFSEYRKIFVWSGGAVVLLVIAVISIAGRQETKYPYKNATGRLANIYRSCGGQVEAARDAMEEMQEELSSLVSSDVRYKYLEDDIGALNSRIEYTLSQQAAGFDVYVLDDRGYTVYFGKKQRQTNQICLLIAVGGLLLILANLYSYEERNDTQKYISATAKGRYKLVRDKSILTVFTAVTLCGLTVGRSIYLHWYNYGFPDFDKHIRNVTLFGGCKWDVTIGFVVVLQFVLSFLVLLLIGFVIGLMSKKLSFKATMAVTSVLFILPPALELLGVTWCRYLSVISLADMVNYL